MLRSSAWLVFIQNDRLVCIPTGSVQPHIALALRCLSRLMEYLYCCLIRMEDISGKKLLMQLLIYRSQVIFRGSQNPVGHGLSAQLNALPVNLLFLPVQRGTHNKYLRHDMDNGFRAGKAAGNDVLFTGCFCNRGLTAFICVFTAVLTGVGVVDIFPDNSLGRNNLQSPDHFLTYFGHSISALRTNKILTLQAMLHLLNRNPLRNGVQGIFVLLVPFMSRYHSNGFFCLFSCRKHLCFVEQEAQLLFEGVLGLLRRCTKLLVPGQAQCFHEQIQTAFKLRDLPSLSLKFLVFRAGNGDHFSVACFGNFCLIHMNIITYSFQKVQKNLQILTLLPILI